jgi:hypothetical protein
MSDDLKRKYTDAYAQYQKYLEEVVFAEEVKEIRERKNANEVQEILHRESDKKK